MNELPTLFTVGAIIAAALATISIWAPRGLAMKLVAVATSVLFMPVAYAAHVSLLSKPKPIAMEWWMSQAEEATVLGTTMREEEGIFLWLQIQGIMEPRSYVLPWSRELALQLQKAMDEAEENQTGVQMRLPFEPSLDNRKPKFYALPQPAPLPKDHQDEPAKMFRGQGSEA